MAGIVKVQWAMRLPNGQDVPQRSFSLDQTGVKPLGGNPGNVVLGFSATAIDLSELDTFGVAWFENLNSVGASPLKFGPQINGAFAPFIRVMPGEAWPMRIEPGIILMGVGPGVGHVRVYED